MLSFPGLLSRAWLGLELGLDPGSEPLQGLSCSTGVNVAGVQSHDHDQCGVTAHSLSTMEALPAIQPSLHHRSST